MTDVEKAGDLLRRFLEIVTGHSWQVDKESKNEEDHLTANGVTVQPSPQNNHRKICPTTGLECIECVPGSPCSKQEQELETAQWYEPMTRWISVEDRLPENGVDVLVCDRHGNVFVAAVCNSEYFSSGMTWRDQTGYMLGSLGITHWMPLPEPLKEES